MRPLAVCSLHLPDAQQMVKANVDNGIRSRISPVAHQTHAIVQFASIAIDMIAALFLPVLCLAAVNYTPTATVTSDALAELPPLPDHPLPASSSIYEHIEEINRLVAVHDRDARDYLTARLQRFESTTVARVGAIVAAAGSVDVPSSVELMLGDCERFAEHYWHDMRQTLVERSRWAQDTAAAAIKSMYMSMTPSMQRHEFVQYNLQQMLRLVTDNIDMSMMQLQRKDDESRIDLRENSAQIRRILAAAGVDTEDDVASLQCWYGEMLVAQFATIFRLWSQTNQSVWATNKLLIESVAQRVHDLVLATMATRV